MPQITAGFDFKSKKPLQDREYFSSLAEMKAFDERYINEGLVAVVNTGTTDTPRYEKYEWYSYNSVNDTTGRWRKVQIYSVTDKDWSVDINAIVESRPNVITMSESEWETLQNDSTKLSAFCTSHEGWILDVLEDVEEEEEETTTTWTFGDKFPISFGAVSTTWKFGSVLPVKF